VLRIVADLGNTRLKWGRLDDRGEVVETLAVPADDPAAWSAAWDRRPPGGSDRASWAVASVNPPAAALLEIFLAGRSVGEVRWFRSAGAVPVRRPPDRLESAGADRALAVVATGLLAGTPGSRAGLVVLCGTAMTVERVGPDGTWQGGAIAPGLGLASQVLHSRTAQLPRVAPRSTPPAWGDETRSAIEAGVYWGVVGAARELLTRQSVGLGPEPRVVWTGGDAGAIAEGVGWAGSRVVPDLVLRGLAAVAFGADWRDAGAGVPR